MIKLTERAIEKVKEIITKNNLPAAGGLRFGIHGGGCGGLQYFFKPELQPSELDEIFEFNGARIFVDVKSLAHVGDSEIDWGPVEHLLGEGFIIKNPDAGSTCGCGTSFTSGDV